MIVGVNNSEIINNEEIVPVQVNKKKNKLSKQILCQFYTTNQEYILQGMKIPDNIKNIIEPFTGNGDLITFIEKISNSKIPIPDVDLDWIFQKLTLELI